MDKPIASRFYTAVGWLLFLNLLVKPVWIFGIDLQVQNLVGTSAYGRYFAVLNLSMVFSFLADCGFTLFFNRSASAMPAVYTRQIGSFLLLKGIFALIYVLVVLLVAWISEMDYWEILFPVIIIQVLTSLMLFTRGIVTAMQQFKTDAWLSVIEKIIMILACAFFIYLPFAPTLNLPLFLWIQIGALLLALDIAWQKITGFVNLSMSSFAFINKRMFHAAIPFALLVFLMSMHNRADAFLLERLHENGDYEAGIYAAAYRLLDAFVMPGNLLIAFLLPLLARKFSAGQPANHDILQVRHFLAMLTLSAIIVFYPLAEWIQSFLYDHDPVYGAEIFRLTLLSMSGYTLIQVYGTVLTARGDIRLFGLVMGLFACINLALNVWLIPDWGASGAALSAIITQHACGICLAIMVTKKYRVPVHVRSISGYLIVGLLLFILVQTALFFEWPPILLIGTSGLLVVLLAWLLKLPDWRKTIAAIE